MSRRRILVVDDDQGILDYLPMVLKKEGFDVISVDNGPEAIDIISKGGVDLVITDIRMPEMDGIEMLSKVKEDYPDLPFIMMTAYTSVDAAIESLNLGASFFLKKPFKKRELLNFVSKALELKHIRSERRRAMGELKGGEEIIIGESRGIREVKELIRKVAPSGSNVLIYGESGTGKELVARAIHNLSPRAGRPFITVNCGALPTELLESELFGHLKGSFTGAIRDKVGLMEAASGGTFFLDEIGQTSPAIQIKLLRAIQEKEITPVGGTEPKKIDIRLIAATNVDLEEEVRAGRFRKDLFYRINVIKIVVPPLRERKEDLDLLINHFLEINRKRCNLDKAELKDETVRLLKEYDWPGNVRELENVIERLVVLSGGGVIGPEYLPESIRSPVKPRLVTEADRVSPTMEMIEKAYIFWILSECGWEKGRAAELLGIDRKTLNRKIERYGLSSGRFGIGGQG